MLHKIIHADYLLITLSSLVVAVVVREPMVKVVAVEQVVCAQLLPQQAVEVL
jgi:hypothetical protein